MGNFGISPPVDGRRKFERKSINRIPNTNKKTDNRTYRKNEEGDGPDKISTSDSSSEELSWITSGGGTGAHAGVVDGLAAAKKTGVAGTETGGAGVGVGREVGAEEEEEEESIAKIYMKGQESAEKEAADAHRSEHTDRQGKTQGADQPIN